MTRARCQELVLLTGHHVAVRMVVGEHDRRRTAPQRRFNHTARIDNSAVYCPFFQPFDAITKECQPESRYATSNASLGFPRSASARR